MDTNKDLVNKENTDKEEGILEEFLAAGVQYGRGKTRTHPSMKLFLLKSTQKQIEIFDINITLEKLKEAAKFIADLLNSSKKILFVGVTPAASLPIKELATSLNQPYMAFKWVGGFLTNFDTIKARLIYFRDLLAKQKSGVLDQYPPRERNKILQELEKMKQIYEGVKDLETRPDAIFIVNLAFKSHKTAKREAMRLNMPIIALAGSDNDISKVKVVIPGNDKAPRSIKTLLNYLGRFIKENLNYGERTSGENKTIES
jgi:small subunit ribosomal protein S2